jgi:RHS repeat-associated protein
MAVRNYYTIDGQMLGYKDAGGRKDFLTDALGSVTGEVDQTGTNLTFNGRYKPYGEMLWSSGSRGSFGWVGTWGYKSTDLKNSSHYVRARHYSQTSGMWTTQDPIWPDEAAYGYVNGRVVSRIDPSGNIALIIAGVAISVGEVIVISAAVTWLSRSVYCLFNPTAWGCGTTTFPDIKFPKIGGGGGGGSTTSPSTPCGPTVLPRLGEWPLKVEPIDMARTRRPPGSISRTRRRDPGACTDWLTQDCATGCSTNVAIAKDFHGSIGPGIISLIDIEGYFSCCMKFCEMMTKHCINPLNPKPRWYCDGILPYVLPPPL